MWYSSIRCRMNSDVKLRARLAGSVRNRTEHKDRNGDQYQNIITRPHWLAPLSFATSAWAANMRSPCRITMKATVNEKQGIRQFARRRTIGARAGLLSDSGGMSQSQELSVAKVAIFSKGRNE